MHNITIRSARAEDSDQIGLLHALSWQKTYKNILPDSFLNNNLDDERKTYWFRKLSNLSPAEFVLVAVTPSGEIVGFIAIMDQGRDTSDAFIDDLHVNPNFKGRGIGSMLLKASSLKLRGLGMTTAYLWVLQGNVAAEEFYSSRGARRGDTSLVSYGDAVVSQTRFTWDSLEQLLKR